MINEKVLEKFAELAVKIGANVQKDQIVFVNASTDTKDLAREIVRQAYLVGAKKVFVNWSDDFVNRYNYLYQSEESLGDVPAWHIDKYKDFVKQGGCAITIASPASGLNNDADPKKLQAFNIAMRKNLSFYYDFMMGSKSQWTIVAAPNKIWAKKVFPNLGEEEAEEALWDAILKASRVSEDNNPIAEWNQHNKTILEHNQVLNNYRFDTLHFQNSLGTNLTIKLVENHIWAGGSEHTPGGLMFNPNIPTEENFTMPYKYGVNGKVVATKPLEYQDKLIEDFWLEFKDGKVVAYDARVNKEILENLLKFDEGSSYLGEIALISYDSPISNSGILFYNTLFDENASCHMALGRAYTINVEKGTEMSLEELKAIGYNHSMAHSDFMFGSPDLQVTGLTKDGKKVVIFKDGDFVI